jgi:flagellar motor switch protein FliG
MSMLDRYKKGPTSMMELVRLIEDSAEPKRTNLLKMIRQEDESFAAKVERRVLDWPKFRKLAEGILAEAIGSCPAKVMAIALQGEDEVFTKMAERCLGKKFSEYRQETELYKTVPPNGSQIDAARKKIISEARKCELEGAFKLMDYDNIDGAAGDSGGGQKIQMESGTAPAGSAKEDDGVPSVDSFGMEPAPAGLLGERLEVYLKKELGIS